MFLIFKPQLGGGFDGGGIAGGYVVPTDKKPTAKKRKPLLKAKAPLPEKLVPEVVVAAAVDRRSDELKERLSALSLDLQVELLKQAQAQLEERQRIEERRWLEAQEAEEQAREQYARELFSHLIEQAERELAAEQAEVLEILDLLDDEGWNPLDAHSLNLTKKRKRPFSKT